MPCCLPLADLIDVGGFTMLARLADLLPKGEFRVLEGQSHFVAPDVLAPIVADFLAG